MFRIRCECGRVACDFQFTENGDIVIYCLTCGRTEIIFKDLDKREARRL
jgi:hypothetical protein